MIFLGLDWVIWASHAGEDLVVCRTVQRLLWGQRFHAVGLDAFRVFQKINDPKLVIASETKCSKAISKTLRLLHYASLHSQ